MKTRNSSFFIAISLFTTSLFLTSCMDNNYYPTVSETLYIYNGTDTTIYIEYGFLEPRIANNRRERDSIPKSMSSWFRFDDALIKNLWMSEKDFNKYVSKIKIYQLNKGDSIFVAPHYYNTKSAWVYEYDDPSYNSYRNKEIHNELTILPEMFNK